MEFSRIFDRFNHQRAYEAWANYVNERGIELEEGAHENIARVQQKPLTGAPGSGRGYSYTEYFTRAAWDENMPPLAQVQIIPDMFSTPQPSQLKLVPGC